MNRESRKKGFLALGSNVGNRLGFIMRAIDLLAERIEIKRCSTVYESEPWGFKDQPPFLNCVLEVATDLDPFCLLAFLKETESIVGRKPRPRWHEREIDIDILLLEGITLNTPDLTVPHRYLKERDFFLIPLLELKEDSEDPLTGVSLKEFVKDIEVRLKPFACLINFPRGT
jgi:2-amino-4-hydroxy-6-hydroxymethyldihydropteridine diphosphokinase